MTSDGSEENSPGSSEFNDDDILYYKSFDGSSMVVSHPLHGSPKVGEVNNPCRARKRNDV